MAGKEEKTRSLLVLLANLALIFCVAAVFLLYANSNRDKIRQQNLADIENINQASSNISGAFFRNQKRRLADTAQYVSLRCFTLNEALDYICDSNSDSYSSYELVGSDCRGWAAVRRDGGYVPVDYTHIDYAALDLVFTKSGPSGVAGIRCTGEFTDGYTAAKSFALYSYVSLKDSSGTVREYTLLAILRSASFADVIDLSGGYKDMATVLVNANGDYVFGSSAFKSDNLFQYFYDYNGLSLDEKNAAAKELVTKDGGEFCYADSQGRDCVFVYSAVTGTQWYCVSCVPTASFRTNEMDLRFTLIIALLLLILMTVDMTWLDRANRRLKLGISKEKEAGAAKTDFLSRMSHDIRTPLNGIIGAAILAGREENPPETKKYLEDIDQSGKFLLSLVNDILDLNKVESGRMELHPAPYSYPQFCANMSAIISPLCRDRDIEFSITGGESGRCYMLDQMRLDQIFFNILSNSVKFTPPGGHISLVCGSETDENGREKLIFTASDDGCGMSEEFQQHMFEPFSQENEGDGANGQGTGLGLAIVHNLVELMDGEVSVRSAPGKGTVFRISIPAEPAAQETEETRAPGAAPVSLAGRRVLLFEDNKLNAEIAGTLLRDGGLEVDYAGNGRAGLEMFRASPDWYYDAVFMDLRMPEMNGLDAARAIRALPRQDAALTPIIAMTANAYDIDVQNCLQAGMNAHLAKPIDPDAMFASLSREITAAESKRRT